LSGDPEQEYFVDGEHGDSQHDEWYRWDGWLKASSPWLDVLAVILLVVRIAQSTLHIGPKQTELVASARFGCYAIQVVCMIIMGVWAAVVAS
jgi:hypothetical protein